MKTRYSSKRLTTSEKSAIGHATIKWNNWNINSEILKFFLCFAFMCEFYIIEFHVFVHSHMLLCFTFPFSTYIPFLSFGIFNIGLRLTVCPMCVHWIFPLPCHRLVFALHCVNIYALNLPIKSMIKRQKMYLIVEKKINAHPASGGKLLCMSMCRALSCLWDESAWKIQEISAVV